MRIIIVSNRLPFTISRREGKIRFQDSAGGLVSGLRAYLDSLRISSFKKSKYLWVGWPGTSIDKSMRETVKNQAFSEFNSYPVYFSEGIMDKYYHGFSNKTIWPLFHYFPAFTVYDETYWTGYKKVNEIFCDTLMEILEPGDVVWIHDYHLMLLPKLLRERMESLPIGFFLHIPFPSFEIFRLLAARWRKEILEGLLGADLIGFHTHDYVQYFLRSVLRILGYDHLMGEIKLSNRMVQVDTFPIGIDYFKFYNATQSTKVEKEKEKLLKTKNAIGGKIVVSIDRLDYTKGILTRLQGFETFLDLNPKWRGKVILSLIVVPSRTRVEHYQEMKKQIDELVGRINGRFGSIHWTPVLYQYRSLPFTSLAAQYTVSDVALITPLRDGMNLIAKEYIASRRERTGVLILSEMAGTAKELGEALIINPYNREEIAEALLVALEMDQREQKRRISKMQKRLKEYDVLWWADAFIQNILTIKEEQRKRSVKKLGLAARETLVNRYHQAQKRLIFLDYDGTLVPFREKPIEAKPSWDVLRLLKTLTKNPRNEVIVISGRDRSTLWEWMGMLPLSFVAEHGIWIKEKEKDWELIKSLTNDWKTQILPLMEMYSDRLPGSFVEEKEYSLVWHFRGADPELASLRVKELTDDLVHFTANQDLQVTQGSKIVEVRDSGVDKGIAGLHWISKSPSEISKNSTFILAIGDDRTDEDLFKILPKKAYSIRVGMTSTVARYNLPSYKEVIQLLEDLTHTK
jgi:trehalose 6-phosphate synthase/phosphatase